MFIIRLTYKKPLEIVDQYLAEHRDFLGQGYQKDYLMVSGPMNPRTGGIIVSQLTDRAIIEDFLKDDPFYIHDIADFEVIEFTPVKYHKDFAVFLNGPTE
jgi:uncharacterized protein YciI